MLYRSTAFAALLAAAAAGGAELRGTAGIEFQGLFSGVADLADIRVSVAALPVDGPPGRDLPRRLHRVQVHNNHIAPAYLAISRGDRLVFENDDDVHHELFSLSEDDPLLIRLTPRGQAGARSAEVVFERARVLHLFCRIHPRSYARVDVVDTPWVRMVRPGEPFEFRGLASGRWRLRFAAPAAETRFLETTALTRPPPVQVTLVARGARARTDTDRRRVLAVRDLFPGVAVEARR
jgi:plastocyanin